MTIFQVTSDSLVRAKETTFEAEGIKERSDLQRLLKKQIDVITPDTLVISEEFGNWEDSKRRVDLLGLDKDANLVVIELKRTEDGGYMELQSIRYAAMLSAMTFDKAVDIYSRYLESEGVVAGAREGILEFLEWEEPNEEEFAQDSRIILASAEFSKELTTSVIWLNDRGLDIRCIRLRPYMHKEMLFIDVQQVIPLPEANEYQVRIREKQQKERASRKSSMDFTRYDLTIDGVLHTNQPKRGLMYHVVKAVVDHGAKPGDICQAVPKRKNNLFVSFEGELDSDGFIEMLMEQDVGGKVPKYKRYFHLDDELFHVDGITYALSNQWGRYTLDAIDQIKKTFPDVQIHLETAK